MKTYFATSQFIPGFPATLIGDQTHNRQFTLVATARTKDAVNDFLAERGLPSRSTTKNMRVMHPAQHVHDALRDAGLFEDGTLLVLSDLSGEGVARIDVDTDAARPRPRFTLIGHLTNQGLGKPRGWKPVA